MNRAFPKADIKGYEHLVNTLSLPDLDDNHILATAIHCQAICIVTFNLKDFPKTELSAYNVSAVHPDQFIVSLLEKHPEIGTKAFRNQVRRLINPPKTKDEVLAALKKCGLPSCVDKLRTLLQKS